MNLKNQQTIHIRWPECTIMTHSLQTYCVCWNVAWGLSKQLLIYKYALRTYMLQVTNHQSHYTANITTFSSSKNSVSIKFAFLTSTYITIKFYFTNGIIFQLFLTLSQVYALYTYYDNNFATLCIPPYYYKYILFTIFSQSVKTSIW